MVKHAEWKILTLIISLWLSLCSGVSFGAPNRPFPVNIAYTGCIRPDHITTQKMNADVTAYYDYWKKKYLKRSNGKTKGGYYIKADSTGSHAYPIKSNSEAHGYGMMTFVLMAGYDENAKEYFDGMFHMFDHHPSTINSHLMSWVITESEKSAEDSDSATDGDFDIAYALLLAHDQWGSDGAINYKAEALTMIHHGIKISDMDPDENSPRTRLGDWAGDESWKYITRSSDWMAGHMIAFGEATSDPFWERAAENVYTMIASVTAKDAPKSGLMPDFSIGNPARAPKGKVLESALTDSAYSWNACRFPFRIAADYAHYQTKDAKPVLNKMLHWLKQKSENNPEWIKAGYTLKGDVLDGVGYASSAFTAPFVAASIVDKGHQDFLNKGWETIQDLKYSYYGDSISLLNMLLISGNWWAPGRSLPPPDPGPEPEPSPNPVPESSWVKTDPVTGKLIYEPDDLGNVLPDFSFCGYKQNAEAIPEVEVQRIVMPGPGDDGVAIQRAIDAVSEMPMDKNGLKGAVLLKKGTYEVKGSISIKKSGVVLRGEGDDENGTVIVATGKKRRTLLNISGNGPRKRVDASKVQITDNYVPAGATSFHVASADGYNIGDTVLIHRPATAQWISDIGMDKIKKRPGTKQWKASAYHLYYERKIKDIRGTAITIDVPLVQMIDSRYSHGFMYKYTYIGRISQVGIEDILFKSTYTGETDESHADHAVKFDHIRDGWLINATAKYFYNGLVNIGRGAKYITVDHCNSLDPKSKITGGRRYAFVLDGSMSLVKNCYSRNGRHDFVQGSKVVGPNAFVNCAAEKSHNDTGPHHRWATGTLFDNVRVKGNQIRVQDRGNWGSGHGWSGAQMVLWNVTADAIVVQNAPGAINWSIGTTGKKGKPRFADRPEGVWEYHGTPVSPVSLFDKQLEDRLPPPDPEPEPEPNPIPDPPTITVTASSDDGHGPENTQDGNLSPESRWSAKGDGEWILYDLGEIRWVGGVDIAFFKGNQRKAHFNIELSRDGSIWQNVTKGTSSGTSLNFEAFTMEKTPARYVRITGHGNSVNTWNSFTEVMIR